MEQEENILGKEKIGKLIRKFSIPCIISMLVNSLYNIVDQIFIGQGVGYLGNGATNVVFPLVMIGLAFSLMFGDGASAYLSLKLGEKKKKEAKKNQKVVVVKEIKLSVKIAENDISYKVKHAREFLEEGNHVKFRVFLKGREMANPQAGVDVLNKVWPMIEDLAVMDKEPKLEGRYVNMMALPKKD